VSRAYRCEIAGTAAERGAAEALTDRVYKQALGLSKPPSAAPTTTQERILIVTAEGRAVATMTLQSAAFEAPPAAALPLELEESYRLESLTLVRNRLAEVRRMAAEPRHPGAVRFLYAEATRLSLAYGIRHWIGLVEASAELASDAALVLRVLSAHGLVVAPMPLQPRVSSPLFDESSCERRPMYSTAQLRRLPVPQRIRSFARLFSARAVSVPTLHPRYRRVVVPMLAQVQDFRSQWLPV
jgi:hypothetical protein